jgi:Domain of unknown function (DUF222)/HNH endonuclease
MVAEVDMETEVGSLALEHLEREIGELAAHIHAATCRWLLLVAEYDRREGWKEWGAVSCGQWLSWRCGIAPRAAREQIRVARRLAELPLAREAFSRGELSYSKVRALSRIATPRTERELVETALHVSAAQLERLVRTYRGVVSTQIEQANVSHDRRYVDCEWDEDGSLVVRARLPAEDGALFIKSLEAARDQLRERQRVEKPPSLGAESDPSSTATRRQAVAAGSAEPRPPDSPAQPDQVDAPASPTATNADALVSMAETLLANGPSQRPAGERYQVVVHVERDDLVDVASDGCCEVEDGPALPAETARRLACDSSLVTIAEQEGRPLSVGRRTRTIPPALRRALHSRDRGCRFPGCDQRRFVDAHHVQHWAHGGPTGLSNLLLLCRHHHRLVHEGGYRVENSHGGGTTFRRPDGGDISTVPRNRAGDRRRLIRANADTGLHLTEETPVARSAGERLCYDLEIEGLLWSEGLLRLGWDGSTPDELRHGSAEPQAAERKVLT